MLPFIGVFICSLIYLVFVYPYNSVLDTEFLVRRSKKMNHLHLSSSNTEMRFLSVCERLLLNNQLTDCTLVAEGQFVQAHRLVLATSR